MTIEAAYLLDANVLIALTVSDHVHHDLAEWWLQDLLQGLKGRFVTCPITQGALIRISVRNGATPAQAVGALKSVIAHQAHEFWPDDLGYDQIALSGVVGHRQVTDAYLAGLARQRGCRLLTLDSALAALHSDVATLLEAPQQN